MKVAVYPGSFDPITYGHLNIIERSIKIFDHLIIAVLSNIKKKSLFSIEERVEMINSVIKEFKNVEVDHFEGLLVDYMKKKKTKILIRGLRAISDFEYEFQMAHMNKKLYPDIETIFMMTSEEFFYVSSALVKEIFFLGGNVECFVPPIVLRKLKGKKNN